MSNDELTPEEREALAHLPRERMPSAGLEDRVVAAMRESGHLARKPARVLRLTTSRVAGLLAACLVLMVGAYSIGLHRGVSNEVLEKFEPRGTTMLERTTQDEELGVKPPATLADKAASREVSRMNAPETPAAVSPEAHFVEKEAPRFEPRLDMPKLAETKDAKSKKAMKEETDNVTDKMVESFSSRLKSEAGSPQPAPDAAMGLRSPEVTESAMGIVTARTFALHGGTLIVDAPDSLRIVTDGQGRTLLIYTSDGVIRIRLAD